MAEAETKTADTKAEAAAEKAYTGAIETVSSKKADEPAKAAAAKIDDAVAEVKAAPRKTRKASVRRAKPAAAKKAPALKKIAAKAKSVAKPTTPKAARTPTNTISNLKDKIMATAKTTDFTTTVKNVTADAQTRAKASYDKFQAYAGDVTEFTKGNVEAFVESGKILGAGLQDLARGEVEAAKGAFETVTADLKAMAAVKSPTELFKLQGEIARRNFDAAVARASKNAEISMKLANDAFAPLSSRMSVAAERFSNAA
jgi:phasin family protein